MPSQRTALTAYKLLHEWDLSPARKIREFNVHLWHRMKQLSNINPCGYPKKQVTVCKTFTRNLGSFICNDEDRQTLVYLVELLGLFSSLTWSLPVHQGVKLCLFIPRLTFSQLQKYLNLFQCVLSFCIENLCVVDTNVIFYHSRTQPCFLGNQF